MKTLAPESTSKDIVNTLSLLVKTSQIHDVNNIAVTSFIQKFLSILNPLLESKAVKIVLMGEFFYINDNRVRYTMESVFNFDFLIKEFRKKNLGTIMFKETLKDKDMKTLARALTLSDFDENPYNLIDEQLLDVKGIDVEQLREIKEDTSELDKIKLGKKTYFSTVAITRGIVDKAKSGEPINLKKTKRVVRSLVNQLIENEAVLMGMTTLKDYDEYTHYHSVNVCILAISLGHKLGLEKKALADLGVAALLHDLGKVDIPLEILNKPTEFTEDEWALVRKHPQQGALMLLKTRGINDASMYYVISAFEHHLHYNLSGYPKLRKDFEIDFFSRIITIADQYDAMTSARVYSRQPLSAEKALSVLVERSGFQVDPHILKVFINMVGVYPIGCLVVLNTKEMGLVFENNNNPEFINRPRILLISDGAGVKIESTVVDLMEKTETGEFKRSVQKVLDPSKYGINLAEYLL